MICRNCDGKRICFNNKYILVSMLKTICVWFAFPRGSYFSLPKTCVCLSDKCIMYILNCFIEFAVKLKDLRMIQLFLQVFKCTFVLSVAYCFIC